MTSALIGYSGFVGSNLSCQAHFDEMFNTANIDSIRGQSFNLLVSAAAPGLKWRANRNPRDDWASIQRLTQCLDEVEADEAVLISTVDVYPYPIEVDENSAIEPSTATPYGRHRFKLEEYFLSRFNCVRIVRLPGLFGEGLKKNIIYDLLHQNCVEAISPQSVYQFYCLDDLWKDLQRVRKAEIERINFATEPVSAEVVARDAFGLSLENRQEHQAARYDFRTIHADIFGGPQGYIRNREQILNSLKQFLFRSGWRTT